MFVLAENAHISNIIGLTGGGTQWNLFLMTGDVPADLAEAHADLNMANMQGIFANSIAGLRLLAINNTTYGQELVAFENVGNLFTLKQHCNRVTNGIAGIQLLPQIITTNIAGLEKLGGYVNGLEVNALAPATAQTHITTDGWIEYDFGTPVSVNRVLYGNSSNAARNPSNMVVEYWNGSVWVNLSGSVPVKTYNATGIDIPVAPTVAQRWRVRFLDNTGAIVANTLIYNYLRFFASEVPADVLSKENMNFTWAVLCPAQHYEQPFAQKVAAFILSAGGPAQGEVVLLNRPNAEINDVISLISLRLKTNVTEEIAQ